MSSENAALQLWTFGTDLRHGRESLADALRQSEGRDPASPGFDWDIAIDVGDMSGGQSVPEDEESRHVVRQLAAMRSHRREQIDHLSGNHDRSGLDEPEAWWWRKWVDPLGQNTESSRVEPNRRPHAIDGTWERYSFRVGNIVFLMMSDINEPGAPIGRGDLGGNPGGCVRGETFDWWRQKVETHRDDIVITAHHHVLKDTTVASGLWEGMRGDGPEKTRDRYHGCFPNGGHPEGASFLYLIDSQRDPGLFESYLDAHPGAVDMWAGGHTHTHPDDTFGGKSHIETTHGGTHFLNVSGLSRYHGYFNVPMIRVLTFTEGSDEVRVRCYMHTSEFLPQGWYDGKERVLKLTRRFEMGGG